MTADTGELLRPVGKDQCRETNRYRIELDRVVEVVEVAGIIAGFPAGDPLPAIVLERYNDRAAPFGRGRISRNPARADAADRHHCVCCCCSLR